MTLRVLIYKRTHTGDPDKSGCFGIYCCMGQVRKRNFDAVIGVGGVSREPVQQGIARKVTWIGIAPHEVDVASDGHPILAFEQFYLKDEKGPLLRGKAPKLAERLFENGARTAIVDSSDQEIESILKLAMRSQPSPSLVGKGPKRKDCNRGRKKPC